MKIAGDEYQVTPEQLNSLVHVMWPATAPLYLLQVGDFGLISFPGEPITAIGAYAKAFLSAAGVTHPVVMAYGRAHRVHSHGGRVRPERLRSHGFILRTAARRDSFEDRQRSHAELIAPQGCSHYGGSLALRRTREFVRPVADNSRYQNCWRIVRWKRVSLVTQLRP